MCVGGREFFTGSFQLIVIQFLKSAQLLKEQKHLNHPYDVYSES